MIEAYVSGEAARVAFVEGTEATYIDAEDPGNVHAVTLSSLFRLFDGAGDVERFVVGRREEAFSRLLAKYSFDRSLRLLDLALDASFSIAVRVEAAAAYVNLVSDNSVRDRVENYVLSVPRLEATDHFGEGFPAEFRVLIHRLSALQGHIVRVSAALTRSLELNSDEAHRHQVYSQIVDTGAFKSIVLALEANVGMNGAILTAHQKLSAVRNGRAIVQGWTGQFVSRQPKIEDDPVGDDRDDWHSTDVIATAPKGWRAFQAVMSQQDFIIKKMLAGDQEGARRFAANLAKWQLEASSKKFAARSMSRLASEARKLGLRSLELDWAKTATELNPDDQTALALLADTYLELLRLPEAEDAFIRAGKLGESEFAAVGLARVHRAAGQLDRAAAELRKAIDTFSEADQINHAWLALAEVSREQDKPFAALEIYDQALKRFAYVSELWCGKASVLRDLGRLEEAATLAQQAIGLFPNDSVPYAISAEILRDLGREQEALESYDAMAERFPSDPVVANARATLLADLGRYEDSLAAFRVAQTKFPYEHMAFCGYAETKRESGDLAGALLAYEDAISRFPLSSIARGGHANVLKLMGRFEDALAAYDRNIRDFPYEVVSMSNRANLLKLLGRYSDAVSAYDVLLSKRPDFKRATYGKAAALIAMSRLDDADPLLPGPNDIPRNDDDWVGLHIRGLLLLKKGNLSAAKRAFSQGTEIGSPQRRRIFATSLIAVEMRLRAFTQAIAALPEYPTGLASAFVARCFLEVGNNSMALEHLQSANDNHPAFRAYVEELSNRAIQRASKGEDWLDDMEVELSLQAA
ncbi:MAG: tetratricopeptide repeat protein [Devosia sp.]